MSRGDPPLVESAAMSRLAATTAGPVWQLGVVASGVVASVSPTFLQVVWIVAVVMVLVRRAVGPIPSAHPEPGER